MFEVLERRHLAAGAELPQPADHRVEVVAVEFVDRDERPVAVGRGEAARGRDALDRADLLEMRVVVPLVVLRFASGETGIVSR